jgi:hypothetical protein
MLAPEPPNLKATAFAGDEPNKPDVDLHALDTLALLDEKRE